MTSKPFPRICLFCNSHFDATAAAIRRGQGKFCSRACYFKGKPRDLRTAFMKSFTTPEEGCWEWMRNKYKQGYGQITSFQKSYLAHRLAWEYAFGSIPDGMFVCHKCDNPSCVRPDHLFLGTPLTNMRDKISKGRSVVKSGTALASAKLTEDAVRHIRLTYRRRIPGHTAKELAAKFGVSASVVAMVAARQAWKHVA